MNHPHGAATRCRLASLDMAGTTVDEGGLVYGVLEQTITDAAGAPVPADLLASWKGTSKREAIGGLLAGLDADTSEVRVDRVFADFRQRLVIAYKETPPTPLPGVPEALAALRSGGVQVALQTGYSADIAESILAGLGWEVGPSGTVDAVVTSDQVPASRPAPYLVFRTMEATRVTDVRSVAVAGDTPNDVGAGYHAGAGWVIGVLSGSFDEAALSATPATHVLTSIADLPALLLG
ncbi:phosphonatase-like hydrolase [Nocardioides lianchengensis]|uniref:Phosphonatase-like hydrolase n=1 Tax=Nocardioides lianchengensis TaxID=1045774 RepID=A0A1G7C6M3_9ACTN|nr:phosphonatase-like hydrolase [Nocardioides lianchengensis]NYG09264.1 phosphonatase-like hydrolase [Nocardioides lianchengensis]SDE34863.1 phosphonatase-like hydrolase [Nocardioides lianchengensis]